MGRDDKDLCPESQYLAVSGLDNGKCLYSYLPSKLHDQAKIVEVASEQWAGGLVGGRGRGGGGGGAPCTTCQYNLMKTIFLISWTI